MHDTTSILNVAAVEAAIAGTQFAGQLRHLSSTTSTNDVASKAALAGARTGVWIADQQIAGRGRGRHAWHSPAGAGIYMSALVAPAIAMQSAPGLSLRIAIAAQAAIAQTFGFAAPDQIDIRWPNDLLLNRKKCGGILIDTASNPATPTQAATLRYAIIGIGINLNHAAFPPELDAIATSIRREMPAHDLLPREPLVAALLVALDSELAAITSNQQPATGDLSACSTWINGKRVRVEARDNDPGGYTGTTAGLDAQGFLLVQADNGKLHTVLSGGLREP